MGARRSSVRSSAILFLATFLLVGGGVVFLNARATGAGSGHEAVRLQCATDLRVDVHFARTSGRTVASPSTATRSAAREHFRNYDTVGSSAGEHVVRHKGRTVGVIEVVEEGGAHAVEGITACAEHFISR